MSTALTTLDGLENGTELAFQSRNRMERWTFQDQQLVNKEGIRIDPFFFMGYLAEGKLFLGDFAPPEPGEWFAPAGDSDRWNLLALQTTGTKTWCAQFSRGQFYQWAEHDDMSVTFRRITAPEWSGLQFLNMTTRAWTMYRQVEDMAKRDRQARNARESVSYAIDYLNRAREQLG